MKVAIPWLMLSGKVMEGTMFMKGSEEVKWRETVVES